MVSLNNLSRLWGIKTVSSCLIPGLQVIRAGGSGPGCESPVKGTFLGVGSGLVGLLLKGALTGTLLMIISRQWLGRSSPSRVSSAPDVKTQKIKRLD